MLTFPLKKEWYEKIKSGEKTIEYREVKPYWTKRLSNAFGYYKGTYLPGHNPFEKEFGVCMKGGIVPIINYCILKMGYSNKLSLFAGITKIEIVDGKNTDLAIDRPVYAIHLAAPEQLQGGEVMSSKSKSKLPRIVRPMRCCFNCMHRRTCVPGSKEAMKCVCRNHARFEQR